MRFIHRRWESLCLKCGLCCYDRYFDGKGSLVVDLSSPCDHLEKKNFRCTIYPHRFRICGDCKKVTIFHALFSRYLPSSCGYVRYFRFWRRSSALPAMVRRSGAEASKRSCREEEA